ncbi:hypothetical protein HCN44_002693 [Aphidius gifuensis]|uniref:Venom protein n=1 Tax=Aphidius gifuensis TaxID=684658 RepID=A0A834XRZ5_APHGI|nr:uncharacterized protein LOC122854483 [Aphidius gifuensis]KAF7991131.1 hypothetical protein HCN44_002693 [Aphidius gifuensis]
MKFQILYIFILFIAINSVVIAKSLLCKKNQNTCSDSLECCSSYCLHEKCVEYGEDRYEKGLSNPCLTKVCSEDERCAIWKIPFYKLIKGSSKFVQILGPGRGFCVKYTPYEILNDED